MSALTSYFSRAADTTPEEKAVELGAAARRVYEDYKNAEIDAFALRLAAEKQAKATSASANIKVAGRGGFTHSSGKKSGKGGKGLKGDLAIGPRDMSKVPQKIPHSISNQITWFKQKYGTTTLTTSTSTITESNIFVTFGALTQAASYTSVFDQYFIYSIESVLEWNCPPGGTSAFGQIFTAIDFDNTANISSSAAIMSYNTCKIQDIKPGSVTRRICRPCVAGSVGPSALAAVTRCWIDCAYTAVPHYGLRQIASATGAVLTAFNYIEVVFALMSNV